MKLKGKTPIILFREEYKENSSLVKDNINVNMRHLLGWTPLMLAAVNGHYEIVKILLEAGADPNLGEEYINPKRTAAEKGLHPMEGTYLHNNVSLNENNSEYLVLMMREEEFSTSLSSKASFRGFTALHYAALGDNFEIAKLLIEKGANPIAENEAGHIPLLYAKEGQLKTFLEEQTTKV